MLSGVNQIIQSFEEKKEDIIINEAKFKDNRQKLAYLYSIYKDPEADFNNKNAIISLFYNGFLDEKNDENIIETLCLTSLEEFGKLSFLS